MQKQNQLSSNEKVIIFTTTSDNIIWQDLLTLYSIYTHFDALSTAFENIVREGEIARNKQFLLFPQCFLLNQIIVLTFVHMIDIISLFAAEFKEPKIGISGKGLKLHRRV